MKGIMILKTCEQLVSEMKQKCVNSFKTLVDLLTWNPWWNSSTEGDL